MGNETANHLASDIATAALDAVGRLLGAVDTLLALCVGTLEDFINRG